MNSALATKDDFIVVDINAIHSISLAFCNCKHTQQQYVQLLHTELYPATVLDPKTAATFHVLKHFQMLSFMSKVSVFEFYYSIARQADNTGCNPPPVHTFKFLMLRPLMINTGSLLPILENGQGMAAHLASQMYGLWS
jgi:CxC2 like cysteine cluster associated with KDZ transposases